MKANKLLIVTESLLVVTSVFIYSWVSSRLWAETRSTTCKETGGERERVQCDLR